VPLSRAVWTTVVVCSSDHLVQSQTSFSVSSMQQPNSSKYDSGLSGYRGHCIMTFTGWMLLNGFSSEWLQLYTSVCTAWLQRTWLNCACPSLRQQVAVVGFGPPQPATWSYHAADCQPTAPVPLVSLVQSAETLYQTICRHLTCLLIVLGSS